MTLDQHCRVVRQSAGRGGQRPFEAQFIEAQLIDEGVDDANRVVFNDVVVETRGQQSPLYAYYPSRQHLPAKTRVLVDFVASLG